jgi:hypothetical protein
VASERLKGALLIAALALGGVYVWFFDPAGASLYPSCPVQASTGTHCPGCGTARAAHALLHFDLRGAFAWNPLTTILSPLLGALLLDEVVLRLRGRPLLPFRVPAWAVYALAATLVVFWIARNLPGLEFLAPHALP